MKSSNSVIRALILASTLLTTPTAFAATPFEIATLAYRGQLDGISGYQTLTQDLSAGKITVADIISAAGETPTPELKLSVESFLFSLDNDD